jgi:hypothetical protein
MRPENEKYSPAMSVRGVILYLICLPLAAENLKLTGGIEK